MTIFAHGLSTEIKNNIHEFFDDQEVQNNFKEYFSNSEESIFNSALVICGNIAWDFPFMYNFYYEEDLYERVNFYLMENINKIEELNTICWFLGVHTKRPLKVHSNKVNI